MYQTSTIIGVEELVPGRSLRNPQEPIVTEDWSRWIEEQEIHSQNFSHVGNVSTLCAEADCPKQLRFSEALEWFFGKLMT